MNDMISRCAAIDVLVNESLADGAYGYVDTKSIVRLLNGLPSAQQETAKRIVGKSKDGMTLWYQCDICNEPVDAQDDFCCGCGRRLTDG